MPAMALTRRQLLSVIAWSTGAAASPALTRAVLAAPVRAAEDIADGGVLDAGQQHLAGQLAEHIIPATDTPGALGAGVDRYIQMALQAFHDGKERLEYIDGLARIGEAAQKAFGSGFPDGSHEEQAALLEAVDRQAFAGDDSPLSRFWRHHKGLTLAGYYTSEVGQLEELRPMPMGPFDGDIPYAGIGRAWS